MASALPVSRLINVSVNLTPAGAQAQSLSNLLILGNTEVIDTVERYRSYLSITDVAADFSSTDPEYLAALLWFQQTPQPTELWIGRWAKTASKGGLRCAPLTTAQQALSVWTAITSGSFKVTTDAGAATDVTGLNFSAATTLAAVAAIIDTAYTGGTVAWNPTLSRFEFKSATTGAASQVSVLSTAATGVDISALLKGRAADSGAYSYAGKAAETLVAALQDFDDRYGQRWYAATTAVSGVTNDEHVAAAAFIGAATNKHVYAVTTQEAGVLVSTSTTDLASMLQAVSARRAFVQYSGSSPYAAVSAMARILTTEYTGNNTVITLMYKQEPGVQAETLSSTQISALEAKNCNVFVAYNNNTAIIEQGKMSDGVFADIVAGTDWLATRIQTALYNLLYTSPTKIPQTDAGMHLLVTTCEAVLLAGVANGLLAPGVWNSNGFGQMKSGDYLSKGFYVYAPQVSSQASNDRAARKSVPIQIAAKLAGAVHTVDVAINVNQ